MSEQPAGEIILYQRGDATAIDVRLDGDTVWLTQEQMAELFGKAKSTINEHIKNVFEEGELVPEQVMRKIGISEFSTKPTNFYNLDVIISVGYRVKSVQGTRFRQWATRALREHLTQSYSLDRQRFEQNAAELEAALIAESDARDKHAMIRLIENSLALPAAR